MAVRMNIHKVLDSLPNVLEPNTIYYILDRNTNTIKTYISTMDGSTAYPVESNTKQINTQHMYYGYPLDVLSNLYHGLDFTYEEGLDLSGNFFY